MLRERCWAAGFFDGEGYAGVGRARYAGRVYARLALEVKQVDARPLRRFADAVGCGTLYLRAATRGRNAIWSWRASGSGAAAALAVLWPMLSQPKREQVERAWREVDDLRVQRKAMGSEGLRYLRS